MGLRRLALGHRRDERILVGNLQRVVAPALLADRRACFGRQVLAARRSGSVRRKHRGRIGQTEQLVVQRVVEPASQDVGGQVGAGGREQIGAAHIADEQGVAREDSIGHLVVRMLVHDDADRLGRVSRRRQDLERHFAEREAFPVVQLIDRELDRGADAVRDDRSASAPRAPSARSGSPRGRGSR